MEQQDSATPVRLFLSYSHQDEELRNDLVKALSLMKRDRIIDTWYDRKILPGDPFGKEIDLRLRTCHVILLLVSADFIASDYCYQREMECALRMQRQNTARVVPIILRPVDWKSAPFGHLLALPTDGHPVTEW